MLKYHPDLIIYCILDYTTFINKLSALIYVFVLLTEIICKLMQNWQTTKVISYVYNI